MPDKNEETRSINRHENQPGKRVIETPGNGNDIIANDDILNAVRLSFITGLSDRVTELAEEIQEDLDRDASRPIDLPIGNVGLGLFELHGLTISFFEAASWILTSWSFNADNELADSTLNYFRSKHQEGEKTLQGAASRDEEVDAVINYLLENGGTYDYQSILHHAGFIDSDLNSLIHEVRMARNEYVHGPLQLTAIENAEEVVSMVAKCVQVVNAVEDLMEAELPVERAFYSYFTEEQ